MHTKKAFKTVITADNISLRQYISSIFHYKQLIKALVIRDWKSRYKQTKFGWFWFIIQPFIVLGVYSFFFTKIIQIDTGNIPYPLIAFSGIVIWNYFSGIVNTSSNALVSSQNIIKNINFPKICLLISKSVINLVDALISFLILLVVALLFGYQPQLFIITSPLIFLFVWLIGITVSLWITAFSIKKRDILNLVPHILGLGLWITPVFYPNTLIPKSYEFFIYLNPIAGAIGILRAILFDISVPSIYYLLGILTTFIFFLGGLILFKNKEKDMAEFL